MADRIAAVLDGEWRSSKELYAAQNGQGSFGSMSLVMARLVHAGIAERKDEHHRNGVLKRSLYRKAANVQHPAA